MIVIINGYKARVLCRNDNGMGIVYLEGPKKGWEDWVLQIRNLQFYREEGDKE